MKAVRLQAYGDVDQFKVEEVPDLVAGDGQVLIDVVASGLNPVDLFVRQGFLAQMMPLDMPAILGIDAAGTVVAVGSGVTGFAPGDRVVAFLPLNGEGAHAERALALEAGLAKIPDNVSFEVGATLPLAGLTGRQAVDALGVAAGDKVLVSGALGAVGRATVQYLNEIGAKPVAGVRGARLDEGRALAGEAVDVEGTPSAPSFDFAVSTATSVAANVANFVRDGGKLASVVQTPDEANPGERIKVLGIFTQADAAQLQKVADAAARGDLSIPVAARYSLDQVAEAHTALAANPSGKIVITNG
ncbi:MAG: NADP-dependent oxidoreductase [Alphaproteobacteria bacterium]